MFALLSCHWDYDDRSVGLVSVYPETYLSLIATDTIYATEDPNGDIVYLIDEDPDSSMVWDTLDFAFTTITTSKQILHWWGEDSDGEIIGYHYRWSSDSNWTFTNLESGVFYVPIRSELDIFSFEIKAEDNEGNLDTTSSRLVLPISNSAPTISFRYLSNPQVEDARSDTSFTFPTRTFNWDIFDQDGNETITDIFYAIDDTCSSCWEKLSGNQTSHTLTAIEPGEHTFYIYCQDIAGAKSSTIHFPDTLMSSETSVWKVVPVVGDVLIVDDYPLDNENDALSWFSALLDTIVGVEQYSTWEVGSSLPYSTSDVTASLNYFKHVIWFSAYYNPAGISDTYRDAEASLKSFVMGGGNLFINPVVIEDTTFAWFPMDSIITLNPAGRIRTGREIICPFDSTLNLSVSHIIMVDVHGFIPNQQAFSTIRQIYKMADPLDNDTWTGNPTICSVGQFQVSLTELSGKAVLLTLPLHDGTRPKLQGSGSSIKFVEYVLRQEFGL